MQSSLTGHPSGQTRSQLRCPSSTLFNSDSILWFTSGLLWITRTSSFFLWNGFPWYFVALTYSISHRFQWQSHLSVWWNMQQVTVSVCSIVLLSTYLHFFYYNASKFFPVTLAIEGTNSWNNLGYIFVEFLIFYTNIIINQEETVAQLKLVTSVSDQIIMLKTAKITIYNLFGFIEKLFIRRFLMSIALQKMHSFLYDEIKR